MSRKIYLKAGKSYPRIDHFLVDALQSLSRSRVERLIDSGRVFLNGRPVSRKNQHVLAGERIEVELEQKEQLPYHPSQTLNRLFEDEWLLIIEKPGGIAVHPGSGEREETILDIFRFQYPQVGSVPEKDRPGLVHRLDKETSGLLLLAKDEPTAKNLQKQFKQRRIKKIYLALVNGKMERRFGKIDAPIGRDLRHRIRFRAERSGEREDLREAVTEYSVVYEWAKYSLLRVMPLTGRTHQIRVHLSSIGHPVAGDTLYGSRKDKSFPRLALHAHFIEFTHPRTKNTIYAVSPFPAELRRFISSLFRKE